MTTRSVLLALVALVVLAGCGAPTPADPPAAAGDDVVRLRTEILTTVPHDTTAFTQGFELSADGGTLWEGTGLSGESELRETDPTTGAVRRAVPLPNDEFGEGITVATGGPGPDTIWQLTWQDGVVFDRDPETLAIRRTLPIEREGWGICQADGELVTSDGTATLVVRDPETFAPRREVAVTADGTPVDQLNELECVTGPDGTTVWANVWQTDEIVGIDPADGRVTTTVDASGLRPDSTLDDPDAVLNGIAAIPATRDDEGPGEFLLTGKRWPTTFRVAFVPAD